MYSHDIQELRHIDAAIVRAESRMADIEDDFVASGAYCCPSCWSPEYSKLMTRNENRRDRRGVLLKRIKSSSVSS